MAYFQKHYEISHPQVEITFLTLLYIYIVLSNHVKFHININMYLHLNGFIGPRNLYKYINFYTYINTNVNDYYMLTIAHNVNKFHYGIYIYIECKSQTIYMQNIGWVMETHPKDVEI